MAPSKAAYKPPPVNVGDTSAPLADHFYIAGIESAQVWDERLAPLGPHASVEDTIAEDEALVTDGQGFRPETPALASGNASKRGSRYSWEVRKSIGSIVNAAGGLELNTTTSNRSSATIRPVNPPSSMTWDDDAFEEALRKFASERDSFLDDMQAAAGVVLQQQRRPRPRTLRVNNDEQHASNSRAGAVGSIQRRLSSMRSMGRQQSVTRNASVRTSKRLSGYTSVIPAPQPFHTSPDEHPLKRRYEPILLDRYPSKHMTEETKRRNPFPDYVPMFTFPNDVSVVSSDERPRSTWHGFAMTNQDNSKLYGMCVVLWVPLNQTASEALERQCESWRKKHMSDEERELASSLGERLSAERARLSRLLASLPSAPSGSAERERLEEEISAVEEKIGLMTDLLRPVRHGAASKIDGLTEGESGFWIPRAYGILGRDQSLMGFWKEWLKAVVVPMTNGGVLRVPASSPKVGVWHLLERYVVNLCVEALSPITSMTQVEVAVRDLRLYARKEAVNEIPASRSTDLYALFRSLDIPNIITLFEFALAESRIILLSSHTAMLQLACSALTSLLYPLKWAGILIPVLPSRLLQALEAPCPYIVGVERRYEKLDLPEDDFCLVDLDTNSIQATGPPPQLPRPQRRKLQSLLQLAAPHHNRFGVPTGPPHYAIETFPHDAFSSENPQVFSSDPVASTLAAYVSQSSSLFGEASPQPPANTALYNAFLHTPAQSKTRRSDRQRPSTGSTGHGSAHSDWGSGSPSRQDGSMGYSPPQPISRSDSGFGASTREKRAGNQDGLGRRNSAVHSLLNVRNVLQDKSNSSNPVGERLNNMRRPSAPMVHQYHSSMSSVQLGSYGPPSTYAPSVYAQSTLAASTVMPHVMFQPVHEDEQTRWVEGHCLQRQKKASKLTCTICDEKCDDEVFVCNACGIITHFRCVPQVSLPCSTAFRADQVRAAFVRCFASLFYTYRKHMHPASGSTRKTGQHYRFNMDGFLKSIPHGDSEYMVVLRQTQAFNEFIAEREHVRADENLQHIKLFDEIINSKRLRGRPLRNAASALFSSSSRLSSSSNQSFLTDTSDHLWRSASATLPNDSRLSTPLTPMAPSSTTNNQQATHPFSPTTPPGGLGDDPALHPPPPTSSGRTPAKLDATLMKEPRSIQGAPRLGNPGPGGRARRKPVPSMIALEGIDLGAGAGAMNEPKSEVEVRGDKEVNGEGGKF